MGFRFFENDELENFIKISKIELILAQIILYSVRHKYKEDSPQMQTLLCLIDVARDLDVEFYKLDIKKLQKIVKNKKKHILNVLDFYEKNKICVFPMYISLKKSLTCVGFVFRIINKYSNYEFKNNLFDIRNNSFESKFYDFINILEKNNILYEIKNSKEMQVGDIIVYCKNNLEYTHVGLVYNNSFEIISKFGKSFIYITPFNNQYFDGQIKVFKINDVNYYENIKNKFIPLIERLKMDKNKILKLIDDILIK